MSDGSGKNNAAAYERKKWEEISRPLDNPGKHDTMITQNVMTKQNPATCRQREGTVKALADEPGTPLHQRTGMTGTAHPR